MASPTVQRRAAAGKTAFPVHRVLRLAIACGALLAAAALHAEDTDEIATDRPDFVESSVVVGKGRFQLETSVALEKNRSGGVKERTLATPTLLRYGISDTLELRLETDGHLVHRADDASSHLRQRGTGDVSLGLKWHALDAAGAMPALGFLVHVDSDSGSAEFRGNGLRPSLRAVAEWELADEFSLAVMPGLIVDRDAGGKRFPVGVFGVVLAKSLNDRVRAFVELAAPRIARATDGGSLAILDVGAAYLLSKDVQLDAGLSKGLNQRSADLSLTFGWSLRF